MSTNTISKTSVDMSKYTKPPKPGLNGDVATQGPPKHGKTFWAASFSRFFPETCRPNMKEPFNPSRATKLAILKDVLWIAIDTGAVDGFAEVGIELPYFIDMKAMIADIGPIKARDETVKLARSICKEHPEIEFVVPDTITTLDKAFVREYVTPDLTDTQNAYGKVFNSHMHFHGGLDLVRAKKHYLFHSRAKIIAEGTARTAGQKTQKVAVALPGGEQISPEVTGQARGLYLGNASLIFALLSKIPNLAKKDEFLPRVYPYGGKDFEGGCRFMQALDPEEAADGMAILKKIEKAAGGK